MKPPQALSIMLFAAHAAALGCGRDAPTAPAHTSGGPTADESPPPAGAAAGDVEWLYSEPAGIFFTRSEITVAEYRACVIAGRCTPADSRAHCNWIHRDRSRHPVNCINWNQARDVCRWLGGRLPTADEWHAEASAGGTRRYPWGETEPTCDHAVWGRGGRGCGRDSTWPVCSKPAGNSVSGLCDMSGNVWEWTSSSSKGSRLLRGGSWLCVYPDFLLAGSRDWGYPEGWSYGAGVRCARPSE